MANGKVLVEGDAQQVASDRQVQEVYLGSGRKVVMAARTASTPGEVLLELEGVNALFVLDAEFSEQAKDPAVVAALRSVKFLVVTAWEANHPLCEVADVVLPGATPAERSGTWTNLQGRVQRIEQAFAPKGQAATDFEILRRIGARLFAGSHEFRNASIEALMPLPQPGNPTAASASEA